MSYRKCGMHQGEEGSYCPYCGIYELNQKLREMGVAPSHTSDNHRCIHGVDLDERCAECVAETGIEPAPAPTNQDVPGKEEGEEELARKYCEERFDTDQEAGAPYHAYLAGLREGKRGMAAALVDLGNTYERHAQRKDAEVAKLEGALTVVKAGRDFLNGEVSRLQAMLESQRERLHGQELKIEGLEVEVGKLREENESLKSVLGMHGILTLGTRVASLEAESARLRELLQVAEGALEFYGNRRSWFLSDDTHGHDQIAAHDVGEGGLSHGGKRAREALAAMGEGKNG